MRRSFRGNLRTIRSELYVVNRFKSHVVVLTGVAILFACGDSRSASTNGVWTGSVDTLESGRLLVRNPDASLWRAGEGWDVHERFRISAVEGDGPDIFGDIRDIEVGPDSNLYVLDGQAAEVRVFGKDGRHLRTFGRSGQGPGELNRAAGFAFDSRGTLWVMNWGNGRYIAFDLNTGALVRETRRLASYAMIPWPGRFARSDELLDVGLGKDGQPVILGLDTAFVPRDTLGMPQADAAHQVHLAVPVRPAFVAPSVRGDLLAVVSNVEDVPTVVVYDLLHRRSSRTTER
jgi:hypothetical protein